MIQSPPQRKARGPGGNVKIYDSPRSARRGVRGGSVKIYDSPRSARRGVRGGSVKIYKALIARRFLLYGAVAAFSACANPKLQVRDVVRRFIDSDHAGRHEAAYACVSTGDQDKKGLEQYREEAEADRKKGKLSYDILLITVSGDEAQAEVEFSSPGPAEIKVFRLAKEAAGWRLLLGWEADQRAGRLLAEGERLRKVKSFSEAKERYEELHQLASQGKAGRLKPETVSAELSELDKEWRLWRFKKATMALVTVQDISITRGQYGGLGIVGTVHNASDKSLKGVEVTVFCFDKGGKVIHQESHQPVRRSGGDAALGPGQRRRLDAQVSEPPGGGMRKIEVKVSDIEL